MVFSSLLFLFRFLPAVLLVYYIVPHSLRNFVLLLFSLIFYAWGGACLYDPDAGIHSHFLYRRHPY